ncbi:MAG TPA: cysteine desulfurase [Sphingobacteriaceae bacterium]|nr:cysteine desulfurase [Sphingobacteriaceae bacterium]
MSQLYPIDRIRQDFPILHREVNGQPLIYLDNGASTQKPRQVIDAISSYYSDLNSNIHRGVHYLSQAATEAYEESRKKIQKFIGAAHDHEVIFTSGTTAGINLVAHAFGKEYVKPGDEILISEMEHHSNIVPWQLLCEERGAILRVVPMDEDGVLDLKAYALFLNEKTRLVSITYISNSLGTVNPVREMIRLAHQRDIPVLLDAAQVVQHHAIDVQELDVDFLVFSGHKMYGPTGVGILYGKEKWLDVMPPYQGGGDMIKQVTFEQTTFNDLPFKFEAGTPNIEAGICLGNAVDYIQDIGLDRIEAHEEDLLQYGTQRLLEIEGLRIIGTAPQKSGVISFLLGEVHPYDVGVILDKLGIAVRTGHHCTQPVMDILGIPGTVRASFGMYNTRAEIDALVEGVKRAGAMLM